ncbi:MAG TPA: A24 family peptidase [Dehalococcoidia bacterium]|jgi:prepilin signal peptidase PulO-like enzyme (type II secretory pathway)
MESLVFFLAGLPLAFMCSNLVIKLTDFDEEIVDGADTRKLPWQVEPWTSRVRWGVVLLLPLFMAVAGSRFDVAQAALISLIVAGLLVCTATDLLRYRVPNVVTYPSIVVVLLAAVFMPDADLQSAVIAAVAAGFCFLVLAVITRGGLGLGDVKLAVLIGALLGLNALAAIFWGVVAGGVVIFALYATGVVGRKEPVPYAPFLAIAAISVALLQGAAFAPL